MSPAAKETEIPQPRARFARSGFPAPIFCAVKADMDCIQAEGTSIINTHTFSPTPMAAESVTPKEFTTVWITRKEKPTRSS